MKKHLGLALLLAAAQTNVWADVYTMPGVATLKLSGGCVTTATYDAYLEYDDGSGVTTIKRDTGELLYTVQGDLIQWSERGDDNTGSYSDIMQLVGAYELQQTIPATSPELGSCDINYVGAVDNIGSTMKYGESWSPTFHKASVHLILKFAGYQPLSYDQSLSSERAPKVNGMFTFKGTVTE